ncbi:MAG: hypothetical protein P9X24_09665 [Candidatus Hatepunaea meridiana]|nr:hypothetical protein [Candidatus Hatepunaea meridiana]
MKILSIVVTFLLFMLVFIQPTFSQPRYHQDDIVTYADSRNTFCVDVGYREVFVATDGGLWRFSRYNGEVLDPWFVGVGLHEAIPLTYGRVVLWHNESGTLWLATTRELLYQRNDSQTWYRFEDIQLTNRWIRSLGEAGDLVYVEVGGGEFFSIEPIGGRIQKLTGELPDGIRWVGRRGWKPHEYHHYNPIDYSLYFDRYRGVITDWEHNEYKPAYDCLNEYDSRRYICYPGLGLGIADERQNSLEILQLGPAGNDVRAIALDDDGVIRIGGNNSGQKSGITYFDRSEGLWDKYEERINIGLASHRVWDALTIDGWVYFTTDQGLVFCEPDGDSWHTIDRFDGLAGLNLRALAVSSGVLYIGGERGVNRFNLPEGPVWDSGSEALDNLLTSDLITDNDTVWAAGLQGVFRIPPNAPPESVTAGHVFSSVSARTIAITKSRVWIGISHGIKAFDKTNGSWMDYSGSVYLNGGKPFNMTGNDSLLWVGTDKGLFRFNYIRGNWIEYGKREGLPHLRVQRLVLEADTLWIGTPRGLTRFIWNRPERDVF